MTATIAAMPWPILIQSIMPAGLDSSKCGPSRKLPHQEGDHAGAGRGGRGGWRTAKERRHLVPWAQEAERIGVPAPHHGRGPGCGEARDQRDVAVEVLRRREAPAPAVDAE